MPPLPQTSPPLHGHWAVLFVVAVALVAAAVAVWIAVAAYRDECTRPGPGRSSRPPGGRRNRP